MRGHLRTFGVNKLHTSRERLLRFLLFVLILIGAGVALWAGGFLAGVVTGNGFHFPQLSWRGVYTDGGPLIDATATDRVRQIPVLITWPAGFGQVLVFAVPLWMVWIVLSYRLLYRRFQVRNPRQSGLADRSRIRKLFSARQVRRRGRFTLPGSSWWQRFLLPTSSFGFQIGNARAPKDHRPLWVDFEQRIRIIAGYGWGKTWRLLIPMIRTAPGAAVVSSIEGEIFTATVMARAYRLPPVRFAWQRWINPTKRTKTRYPVVVADLTAPETRFAAGWPRMRWNPIPGCEDYTVAVRRAEALINGCDVGAGGDRDANKFFSDSASEVLAAWLHAAALDESIDVDNIREWLTESDKSVAERILLDNRDVANESALLKIRMHLSAKAEKTTNAVERYLTPAVAAMASGDGRRLVGNRGGRQFDMAALIAGYGTMYLLADKTRIAAVRPVLSLIASEMYVAAEAVARLQGGKLRRPFYGFFDELLYGVRLVSLPEVVSTQRKFLCGVVWAAQASSQEDQAYGKLVAQEIRKVISIYGGIDAEAAKDIANRAGNVGVVSATRNDQGGHSESVQQLGALTEADQQELGEGESVILRPGVKPFLAYTPTVFEQRTLRKRIAREQAYVKDGVKRATAKELAVIKADSRARVAGYATTSKGTSS